ncbi:MAG TPA: hypothetical protein VNN22_24165 [Verrucomicrobiae bacterium]|nr:hypothetical protein [Verrucomicrobiae bacterium]
MKNSKLNTAAVLTLLLLALLSTLNSQLSTVRATPYFSAFRNTDGTPMTNAYQMQAWPPVNTWIVYGTNMVYGGRIVTNTPDATGYLSNSTYPNTFRIYFPDLDSGFYVSIPDTTNFLSLSVYATNTAVFAGTYLNGFGLVTNWLHFAPATNTPAGILAAEGFQPATNAAPISYSQLPFTPPTNTPAGMNFALGFQPATNNPSTNVIIFISGITTFTNASGAVTNITFTFGTNTLNYQHQ